MLKRKKNKICEFRKANNVLKHAKNNSKKLAKF